MKIIIVIKKIKNLRRYSTKEGEITIPLFDKDNKRVIDLKKYKQENEDDNKIYEELKIRNDICKFGYRVQQANIQYELSNNKDFDNGVIKTQKEEEFKNQK